MSIFSADGTDGNPGIRIIEPALGTIKPAPEESSTFRMRVVKSRGLFLVVWSSDRDFCVLAIHTARLSKPSSLIFFNCSLASRVYSTFRAPYINVAMVSIFFSRGHDMAYSGVKQSVQASVAPITASASSTAPLPPSAHAVLTATRTLCSSQYAVSYTH